MSELDAFDYFAFVVIGVLVAAVIFAIVVLGSLPGKIAVRRGHPYATAVSAASWISFVTLGALWPLAFIWAFLPVRSGSAASDGGDTA